MFSGFSETMLLGMLVIMLGIIILVYVLVGLLLNKLNKLMYGKGTPMAWIPFANVYLLGKLTINKMVGWILILCCILTGTFTVTINDVQKVYTLLPLGIKEHIYRVYDVVIFTLLVYAIIKYFKLKKIEKIAEEE